MSKLFQLLIYMIHNSIWKGLVNHPGVRIALERNSVVVQIEQHQDLLSSRVRLTSLRPNQHVGNERRAKEHMVEQQNNGRAEASYGEKNADKESEASNFSNLEPT